MDTTILLSMASFALAASISPGPVNVIALASGSQHGFRRSFAYVSGATVYHSHNYSPWQDFQRYFDIGVFHACTWNILGQFGTPTGAGTRFLRSEARYLLMRKAYLLIMQSLVRNGLKMAAYALGRRYTLLPRRLARSLSMHPLWWN